MNASQHDHRRDTIMYGLAPDAGHVLHVPKPLARPSDFHQNTVLCHFRALDGIIVMIKSLCIFCGSRNGTDPIHRAQAERLGALCGRNGIEVIYGGGHVGLMGAVADAAMAAGGSVVGIIPEHLLQREVGHRGISELIVTDDMFERKDRMLACADAFVALPGGLGTLDEFFEVLTLHQLGRHQKPMVLVNIGGFWDPLIALIRGLVTADFAGKNALDMFQTLEHVDQVLPALGIDGTEIGSPDAGNNVEPIRRAIS